MTERALRLQCTPGPAGAWTMIVRGEASPFLRKAVGQRPHALDDEGLKDITGHLMRHVPSGWARTTSSSGTVQFIAWEPDAVQALTAWTMRVVRDGSG